MANFSWRGHPGCGDDRHLAGRNRAGETPAGPTVWKPAPLSRYESDQISCEKRRQRRSGLWEFPGFEREDSAGVAKEAAGVDRRGAYN